MEITYFVLCGVEKNLSLEKLENRDDGLESHRGVKARFVKWCFFNFFCFLVWIGV